MLWRCIKYVTNLYKFPDAHSNHKSCICTRVVCTFFLFRCLFMKFLKRTSSILKLIIGKTTFFINDNFQLFLHQHLSTMKRRFNKWPMSWLLSKYVVRVNSLYFKHKLWPLNDHIKFRHLLCGSQRMVWINGVFLSVKKVVIYRGKHPK